MNKKILFVITYIILLISIVMQAFISVLVIYTIWYAYNINKYFDIEVQPHYKDEVVVFFKDYHVNPESLKPMIYEIKTQEE
jgi:uncharacterized membrane-anchored protein YitT (DUF2179 family)